MKTPKKEQHVVPDAYMANYDGFEQEWISTSALETLFMCGLAFWYKYVDRTGEPVRVRQCAGIGTHFGREYNLRQKLDTEMDLPMVEVTDAARDKVQSLFGDHDWSPSPEFAGKSKPHARGICTDMAVELTAEDYGAFQVDLKPAGVEETMAVQYPGLSRLIVGKVDVRLPTNAIIDLKTGKRAYGQSRTDESMSLSTYGLLTLVTQGILPPSFLIHNVVRSKTGCRTDVYETTRTKEDLQRQLERFAAGIRAIEAGNFCPCSCEHWKCCPEWCGFFYRCKYGGAELKVGETK